MHLPAELARRLTPAWRVGMLRTLDLSGFNLTCAWSQIATPIASMTSLVELDLSGNPLLTVRSPLTFCDLNLHHHDHRHDAHRNCAICR